MTFVDISTCFLHSVDKGPSPVIRRILKQRSLLLLKYSTRVLVGPKNRISVKGLSLDLSFVLCHRRDTTPPSPVSNTVDFSDLRRPT